MRTPTPPPSLPQTGTLDPSRRRLVAALAGWPLWTQAQSPEPPSEVAAALTQPRLQGSGRLRFLGLHVYDARLWVQPGFRAEEHAKQPLAIELEYARTLYGRLIAERSVTEMKKVGEPSAAQAEAWQAEMTRLFPDVAKGDRLTGVQRPGEPSRFFLNGQLRGEVKDPAFGPLFFGIWLSPRSSEPALRQALISGGKLGS